MRFEYNAGQCGAGKTLSLTSEMGSQPGRYVYVVDRIEVLDERERLIREAAEAAGHVVIVERVVSKGRDGGAGSVASRLAEIPSKFLNNGHVVVMVTNKGLQTADFHVRQPLRGLRRPDWSSWEIIIDEDFPTFSNRELRSPALALWFAGNFGFEAHHDDLFRIVAKPGAPTVGDILSDTILSAHDHLVEFRRLVDRGEAYTAEGDWTAVAAGQSWSWFSVWSLRNLAPFKRRRIVASGFPAKLTKNLAGAVDNIVFRPFELSTTRPTWAPRNVLVRYFADQHEAGSTFWKTDEGKAARDEAFRWIASNASNDHIWVANSDYSPPVPIPGHPLANYKDQTGRISAKCHGLNDFRSVGEVSAIYAAKGSPNERRAVAALCGLDNEDAAALLTRDREHDDLSQIVLRTSLRDPRNPQPVVITVYDKVQADFVASYIEENDFGAMIELELIDSSVNFRREISKGGRPTTGKAASDAERQRVRRSRVDKAEQSAGRKARRQAAAAKQRSA